MFSPSLQSNDQAQTPACLLTDLLSSFLIKKTLNNKLKNSSHYFWLQKNDLMCSNCSLKFSCITFAWMELTLNTISFISLQRQVHSISVCGGVSWGRWWSSEGSSAWSHLHGCHGLWHGQLLSAGTEQTHWTVYFHSPVTEASPRLFWLVRLWLYNVNKWSISVLQPLFYDAFAGNIPSL